MAHLAMFADGIHGLMFSMNTDLVDPAAPTVSHRANDRIQLALVPFALVKNADGSVAAKATSRASARTPHHRRRPVRHEQQR